MRTRAMTSWLGATAAGLVVGQAGLPQGEPGVGSGNHLVKVEHEKGAVR